MIELCPQSSAVAVQPLDLAHGLDVRRLLPAENPDERDRAEYDP